MGTLYNVLTETLTHSLNEIHFTLWRQQMLNPIHSALVNIKKYVQHTKVSLSDHVFQYTDLVAAVAKPWSKCAR